MESLFKNPGFQHIVEKSLMCLDRKSIAIFRLVNQDCKGITDIPSFYLKKLAQENSSQDLIENWKQLIKKIPSDEIKHIIISEFFQMYTKRSPKYPLELAQELAVDKDDSEFLMFIIEFSSPTIFVKPAESIAHFVNLNPMHLAAWF